MIKIKNENAVIMKNDDIIKVPTKMFNDQISKKHEDVEHKIQILFH